MPNMFAKALLIVIGIFFIVWDRYILYKRLKGNPDKDELIQSIYLPALIMTLALAANALAFMQMLNLEMMMEMNREVFRPDGSIESSGISQLSVLRKQLSIIIGTGLLMLIIRNAIDRDYHDDSDPPRVIGVKVQMEMYKNLMVRHWWAVIGVGAVFGVITGPGVVLLLALELTIMWFGCYIGLRYFKHKLE